MAVKDAEKSEEGTKTPEATEQDKKATALLDELKAEEKADASKEDESKSSKKDEDKKEDETKGEAEGEKGASDDDSESQAEAEKKKPKSGYARRNSRLVKQRNVAQGDAEQANEALNQEREKGKLKDLRIAQLEADQISKVVEPKPDDFDGGEVDPEYVQRKKEFDQASIKKMVSAEVAEATKQTSQVTTRHQMAHALKERQTQHWENADEMGNKDYDEKEEKAIDTMGKDMVNHIIENCPADSHKVIYYLGANENEAEELAGMLSDQSTMVKAVLKLGQIQAKLTANPQNLNTPDPDEETEGSASSPLENLTMKLDKLREKSGDPGGMRKVLDFKKKARERGITLK